MHPAERLWNRHHPPTPYPDGLIAVPAPIPGIAFFPGGFGLWRPDPQQPLPHFPVRGVMVLGHDFHSEAGYHASFARTRESATQPTWRNLLALLARAHIRLERCFFTNVYMGLRLGYTATGPFPGATDPAFVAYCAGFLREQLRAQLPTLILTLGINVPPILGSLSDDLVDWTRGSGLKHLDAGAGPVRHGVTFQGVTGLRATVVALTHPSQRPTTVRHRRYGDESGDRAELLMLEDALAHAPTYLRESSDNQ